MPHEPYVSARVIADHLDIQSRQVLAMTRAGKLPAHPVDPPQRLASSGGTKSQKLTRPLIAMALTVTALARVPICQIIKVGNPVTRKANDMVKGSGNGWFRTRKGKKAYCWYNDTGDERSKVIGDSSMNDTKGWLEVAKLKLNQQVGKPDPKNAIFGEVLNHWLAYGKTKTGEVKDDSTNETDQRNARNYLSHWADHVAKDMEPLEIQQWLDKQSRGLRSKLRNTMSAVFNHGLKFGIIPRGASGEIDKYNPMKLVSAPCKSDFESVELSGAEAAAVIRCISDPLVKVLAILIAVTGMRISEALALSWDAIDWIREKSVYGASGMASPMVLRSPA
jgi:hypothetical protein